jgi:ElaB/YqjD/DUF883 family membrane-anchored ribosome-binding protein
MNSKTATKTPENSAGDGVSQLREQTATIKEDIRKLGSIARDVAQEKLDEARNVATDAVGSGRQRAEEMYEQGRDKAEEVEDQVVDYVRNKPIKSMLIAGGVGIVLGFFLSSRR